MPFPLPLEEVVVVPEVVVVLDVVVVPDVVVAPDVVAAPDVAAPDVVEADDPLPEPVELVVDVVLLDAPELAATCRPSSYSLNRATSALGRMTRLATMALPASAVSNAYSTAALPLRSAQTAKPRARAAAARANRPTVLNAIPRMCAVPLDNRLDDCARDSAAKSVDR